MGQAAGHGTRVHLHLVVQQLHPAVGDRRALQRAVVEVDGTEGEPVQLVTNIVDATQETLRVGARVTLACDRLEADVGLPRFRLG